MTVALTINGLTYDYPESGDEDWGNDATDWAEAVTSGMLQKAGGSFFLLAEVDFGASYGLKSIYYKSRTANAASAGQVRLARADVINWRNEANSADLSLAVNSSNILTFNGTAIQNTLSVTDTSTIDLTLAADVLSAAIVTGSITNAMVNASAAIAYSKLALTGSIVNADISASAAIAYSKLALTGAIVNADISASAAIDFSKLATLTSGNILVGSAGNVATSVAMSGDITITNAGVTAIGSGVIVNADVNASAAIAVSKLAALTASRAVVSDGSGFLAAATTTATEIGYLNGVTSAIQTQLDARVLESLFTAKGDLIAASAANTPATLTVGTDGQVLTANSANPTGLGWSSPLTNPMDSEGDLIVGGVAGAATKLDAGTSNYLLKANGAAAPSWALLVNANVDASAAIALTKLAATTASRALVSDGSGFVSASAVTATQIGYLSGASGTSGTGSLAYTNTPSFTTPVIGAATGTSLALTTASSANMLTIRTTTDNQNTSFLITSQRSSTQQTWSMTARGDTATTQPFEFADATAGITRWKCSVGGANTYIGTASWSASEANPMFDINNSVATASSSTRILYLRFTNDTDCTGGYFQTMNNSSGTTIGRIEAASNTTVSYTTSSDKRLKTGLAEFDSLGILDRIKVGKFKWLAKPGDTEPVPPTSKSMLWGYEQYGAYAQDLNEVFPQAVSNGTDELTETGELLNPWAIDYSKLVPVLIDAVQKLSKQVAKLEKR